MEEFRLEQLTKELVAAKLKAMDDPCEAAAALVAATLRVALKPLPAGSEARESAIRDACRGGMTGLILTEQNVARGAVRILEKIAELSADQQLDPTKALESSLRGIADVKRFLLPERAAELRAAVEANFLGAGQVLAAFMEAVDRQPREAV